MRRSIGLRRWGKRHTSRLRAVYPEPEESKLGPRQKKKKNYKRWCRGREGHPHEFGPGEKWFWFTIRRCVRCGRKDWGD